VHTVVLKISTGLDSTSDKGSLEFKFAIDAEDSDAGSGDENKVAEYVEDSDDQDESDQDESDQEDNEDNENEGTSKDSESDSDQDEDYDSDQDSSSESNNESDDSSSQLNNDQLIKAYLGPTSKIVLFPHTPKGNKALVDAFKCYLDVAVLSYRLSMQTVQTWAKGGLSKVMHNSGKTLATGIDNNSPIGRANVLDGDDEVHEATDYAGFQFSEAARYARSVKYGSLLHVMFSILDNYWLGHEIEPSIGFLLSFFRIIDLRTTEPSLFGFLFLLLLTCGNQAWTRRTFTPED
jgi:hypothetical protein